MFILEGRQLSKRMTARRRNAADHSIEWWAQLRAMMPWIARTSWWIRPQLILLRMQRATSVAFFYHSMGNGWLVLCPFEGGGHAAPRCVFKYNSWFALFTRLEVV